MKSYKNFVSESHIARENLNEFLGLGKLAGKGLSYMTGGAGRSAATKVANFLGGVYAADRLQDTVRKGDKVGAYNAGAMFIPGIGPYSTGLKLGAMGLDLLRQKRAEKANKEKMEKKNKEKKVPLKPTHSSFKDYVDDVYGKDRYGN
tara:strand:+ start:31 stop:471 length:441 start_codon:yes stop_codon:yes gene_type:complete